MNVNAKQINSVDYHSMDITTVLGFFGQIKDRITPEATLPAEVIPQVVVATATTTTEEAKTKALR